MKRQQQGMALITVMILVVVVLAVLATLFFRHGVDVARFGKTLHGEQATLLAMSGELWAIEQLREDINNSAGVDSLDENWAQGMPVLPVEGGTIKGELVDLQSRFNINQFADITAQEFDKGVSIDDLSIMGMLWRLALQQNLEFDPVQLASLIDWQDSDDVPLNGGAEANDYLLLEPAYRPANDELVGLDELAQIMGYEDGTLLKQLRRFMVALPADAITINVNTASAEVLLAISPAFDKALVEALIEQRENKPWATVDEFYTTVMNLLALTTLQEARDKVELGAFQPISVSTRYFLLSIFVEMGVNTIELQSVIRRNSSTDVEVLSRSLKFLPQISGNSQS